MPAALIRYSDEQLSLAKSFLQIATENVALAFWTDQERFAGSIEQPLRRACEALGFVLAPIHPQAEKETAART
jgi:hypothetical protein